MEGKQHGDVVSAIKAGGDETKLLVVDPETDEFFKKCRVVPAQEHINGETHKLDSSMFSFPLERPEVWCRMGWG